MSTEARPAAGTAPDHRLSLRPLLDLAAAAAGFVVLIQLVGRAVMWARFDAIGLPATQAVSLQPLEVLLVNGAGALGIAIALGVAAVGALAATDRILDPRVRLHGRAVVLIVLELILVTAVVEQRASWGQRFVALGAGLVAGAVFWALAQREHLDFRRLVLAVFLLISAVGGVLAFVRNSGPPARFPMVTVFLKDGSLTTGAYVALSSDDLYLAADSFNRTYGQLTAIPRSDVTRFALSPPQEFEEAGRDSARPLLAGKVVKPPYGSVAPDIARYLAGQAGDPVWKYPPVSFLESAYYLSRHPAAFFGPDPVPPVDAGRSVSLERLVEGARDYSGRPVRTSGVVVRAAEVPGGEEAPEARFITLRGRRDARARLFCLHIGSNRVPVGRTVRVEGVIVNAGTVADPAKAPTKGIFVQAAGNACGY
jgi:hypothetical protein